MGKATVKRTTDQIVASYRLINNAKLTKMEDAEKFALIKAARKLKKTATDFEDALKDTQERLKPEGFDAIAGKMQARQDLTPEESAKVGKYNTDVTACLKDELDREVELEFEPLSEDALERFIASNDFSVAEIMAISDVIGA